MNLQNIVMFRSCFGAARILEFETVTHKKFPEVDLVWQWDTECHLYYGGDYGPSIIQPLPKGLSAEQWADIGASCISCRAVFQVLGEGLDIHQCIDSVGQLSEREILSLIPNTWAIQIKHMGKMKRLHPDVRTQKIEMFRNVLSPLNMRPVQINNPESELWLLEDCRTLEKVSMGTDRQPTQYSWLLLKVDPSVISVVDLAKRLDVKSRAFISTTTLPAERSILMSNLGKAKPKSTVLDPFCGSGGLLLSSSILGATVVGSDIDDDLLHHQNQPLNFPSSPSRPGRGKELVSYIDSFSELGLDPPKLCVLDIFGSDIEQKVLVMNNGLYNAIVTDPPYGIRESQSNRSDRELLQRLFEVASKVLTKNGRLVFLMLVECTASTVESCQKKLSRDIVQMITHLRLVINIISLERFNSRLWRATVVLTKEVDG